MTAGAQITTFGDVEPRALQQLERCLAVEEGARGVLCADNHVGYSQPIGGAVAYRDHISPSGVGYDIGCGNKAVCTNLVYDEIAGDIGPIMDAIYARISFGVGRKNQERVDHPVLDAIRSASLAPQRQMIDLAAEQLGTVGAGNHYVDLFRDELDRIWVGVHFGSRGFGHKTASGFLALSQGLRFTDHAKEGGMDSPPVVFAVDSEIGQAYIEAMELAGAYAYAGRDLVVGKVMEILGAEVVDEVHNHHNFAWRETHGGEDWWVVRKGCTPAFPGQRGFVGATMAGTSVILEGVESDRAEAAMFSTIHGAGRVMSRTQAAGKWRKRWVNDVRDDRAAYETRAEALAVPGARSARRIRVRVGGAVDFDAVRSEVAAKGIELRGGAADESPPAYKNLDEVLRAHAGTIDVRHALTPVGVAMASADTFDPYKD